MYVHTHHFHDHTRFVRCYILACMIAIFYRYYDQLVAIESKLPIAENQIRIDFKWKDCFEKASFFSGKRTLSK